MLLYTINQSTHSQLRCRVFKESTKKSMHWLRVKGRAELKPKVEVTGSWPKKKKKEAKKRKNCEWPPNAISAKMSDVQAPRPRSVPNQPPLGNRMGSLDRRNNCADSLAFCGWLFFNVFSLPALTGWHINVPASCEADDEHHDDDDNDDDEGVFYLGSGWRTGRMIDALN